jgi:mRNA interferase MazF
MLKRFLEWIALKQDLHNSKHKPPHVSEGDIWWASIGENVGSEINGKSGLFSRPVVVLRKLSHGFYFVVPTTTQQRIGSWFVAFRQNEKIMSACLHQARSIDYRRLSSKLGTIDDEDFMRVKDGFRRLIE